MKTGVERERERETDRERERERDRYPEREIERLVRVPEIQLDDGCGTVVNSSSPLSQWRAREDEPAAVRIRLCVCLVGVEGRVLPSDRVCVCAFARSTAFVSRLRNGVVSSSSSSTSFDFFFSKPSR